MDYIFLGSFNPPHIGHVNCITTILNKRKDVSNVYVIPALQNPNKDKSVDFDTRYEMCKNTFENVSLLIHVLDIEKVWGVKYTYELIELIKENKTPISTDFTWVVTLETFRELINDNWKNAFYILSRNKFLILHEYNQLRLDIAMILHQAKLNFNRMNDGSFDEDNYEFMEMNSTIPIHSRNIRKMIFNEENPFPWINEETFNIIIRNNLYHES